MPIFGGTQGQVYTANILDLEKAFNSHLAEIEALPYDILDVKQTQWHDHYGQLFKDKVKNLEMSFQNIIALAFKNISTVQDAVELLENFDTLAKRPQVKEFVHNKAASTMVMKLFQEELIEVYETFEARNKKPIPMPFSHPYYAGQAIWAYSLIVRLDRAKDATRNLYFVNESPVQKEALDKYTKLREQLDQFIEGSMYKTWEAEIAAMDSTAIDNRLDMCILTWSDQNNSDLPSSLVSHPLF
jgi:hypothetical protein